MRWIQAVFFFSAIIAYTNAGLNCWECEASSEEECSNKGKEVACSKDDNICLTEVQHKCDGAKQIRKYCQGQNSCLQEQAQNWRENTKEQCSRDESSPSVYRCCCFKNLCNQQENCENENLQSSCKPISNDLSDMEVSCSNSNKQGSVCKFKCTRDDVSLHPVLSTQSSCLPNGKWSNPIPCCRALCPPNVPLDMAALIHRSTSEDIDVIKAVAASFLGKVNLGPDGIRYARMHYSGKIHDPQILFSDSAQLTSQQALKKIKEEFHFNNTKDGRVNTGAALWYIYYNVFGNKWDRPYVPNILFVSSDTNSDDDLAAPARALREKGVLIFAVFYRSHKDLDMVPNQQQLLDITGGKPQFITKRYKGAGMEEYETVTDNLFQQVCYSSCNNFV